MAYIEKPIAKWEQQGVMHMPGNEGTCPSESVDGDNPSVSVSAALPDQGDQRVKASGRGAPPTPAMPGAGS